MSFENAETESEFIDAIRSIFRAYVPESDAWAKPNFFDINATVIGGLAWSGYNEARNGIDARLNIRTVQGEALDLLAATPPLNFFRLGERPAMGSVKFISDTVATVNAGEVFTTADGVEYTATETVTLVDGMAEIPVTSNASGIDQNSLPNQPLDTVLDGEVYSCGIVGGADVECDEDFRNRIFAERSKSFFFGSQKSYENIVNGYPGVTRVYTLGGYILPIMDGTRPCGIPTCQDLENIADSFNEPCLTPAGCAPTLALATGKVFAPEINWCKAPDFCAVELAIQTWLRANYGLGDSISAADFLSFLNSEFRGFGATLGACCDFSAEPHEIYSCVEIIHGC